MQTKYKNRQVEYEVQYESCAEDCFITSATYVDSGIELCDDELDKLQEQEVMAIDEAWFENQVGRAEYMMDE